LPETAPFADFLEKDTPMRSNLLAVLLATTSLALSACAGEEPPPQPPPPPPPPPVDTVATAAPVDTTPPPPPPKPAVSELIVESMHTLHEGFNKHDPAKMASAVTDDVVELDYGAGEGHSKAEFQNGMGTLFTAFPDAKTVTNRIWKKGNVVITELTWTGTMTGELMGMKPTGKPVGQMRLHVYTFNDDGLVKEVHEYADMAGLLAQMEGKKGAPPVPMLPTNPPEMHIAGGNPEQDKLADWAKKTDEPFNADNYKTALAEIADDGDYWLSAGGGMAMKGKKELEKGLKEFFTTFPDQKWTATNAWGIDGFGIIEHTMTGTMKGPFGPIRPTGKPVTAWHNIDIMQPTADGKIQHGWGYSNSLEALSQAGALPKHGPPPPAGNKPPVKPPPPKPIK
jgi:predicted ester cyclase